MTRVIPFPKPGDEPTRRVGFDQTKVPEGMAWFHCAGNCGALVTSAGTVCLTCAAKDER